VSLLESFGRPCPCEECGRDDWRSATSAEADGLERRVGLPGRATGLVAAFYWTCQGCGNGAVVILGGFEHLGLVS